ncbi:MAG: hypothetical protein Q4615_06780 [Paracoccus aminovorans]|nr:hypothetical protein [Paracoccus aminovorans]
MVDEDRHGRRTRFGQRRVQPGKAIGAVDAADHPGLVRVQEQEPAGIGIKDGLDVTVRVARVIGEGGDEFGAAVVIAQQKPHRKGRRRKDLAQKRIGFGIAVIAEISGDHQKVRVGVPPQDVGHRRAQPRLGIDAIGGDARRHQMRVSQLDDLHGGPCERKDAGQRAPHP